ncbi:cytochrome c [Thioalkalivibrio sp. ALMg11]|uniref:cytochrome c n=1 Tax=Thioalkalivibrio sp. ALMg11 TaxID=1158165 RepID=UPI00037AF1C3|nr:cytochrome c [Thioalkalivibrio sp. ALMg11]
MSFIRTRTTGSATLVLALLVMPLASTASAESFQSVMQDLADDMNRVQSALFVEDFDAVTEAAEAIADHPRPSLGERRRMLSAVGTRVGEFRSLDQQVHEAAKNLADAARDQDLDTAIRYHGRLVNACIACHSAFRDEVVNALSPEAAAER